MNINRPMTVNGYVLSEAVIHSALGRLEATFTNMSLAGILGRAGFVPDDLWVRQEAANRLLQRLRKAGLVSYCKGQWTFVP